MDWSDLQRFQYEILIFKEIRHWITQNLEN